MSLTISLSEHIEKKLHERARAAGVDASKYAAQLLEESLGSVQWLEEISGDTYRRFLESGITDDQLGEELEKAKHEMRAERRARRGS